MHPPTPRVLPWASPNISETQRSQLQNSISTCHVRFKNEMGPSVDNCLEIVKGPDMQEVCCH